MRRAAPARVRARLPAVAIAVSVAFGGCTCGSLGDQEPSPSPPPRELARWDFGTAAAAVAGDGGISLWPRAPGAPERKRHAVRVGGDAGTLDIASAGGDPHVRWQFAHATAAWVVHADLETTGPGDVQMFWTSAECPVFAEACSTIAHLPSSGSRSVDFVLPPTRGNVSSVRSLRFDTPADATVSLHHLIVRDDARVTTAWRGREGHTTLTERADGLLVSSHAPDPWLTTELPGLDAEAVDAVELGMTAPPSARPQLFWRGAACPNFAEECSAAFVPDGREADAWRCAPGSTGRWRGRIDELRIDPSDEAADYLIRRVVLVRATHGAPPK